MGLPEFVAQHVERSLDAFCDRRVPPQVSVFSDCPFSAIVPTCFHPVGLGAPGGPSHPDVRGAHCRPGEGPGVEAEGPHDGGSGVGTFAIQLAKHLRATVATTTSTSNVELVRSLGCGKLRPSSTLDTYALSSTRPGRRGSFLGSARWDAATSPGDP